MAQVRIPPPWTAVHNSPNRSVRQPVARLGAVLHHAAMTDLDGLRRLAMGAKQVSATAIVKDGKRELIVPSNADRPWSLSSAWGDSAFRSIECANQSVNGWTISDESVDSMALVVAYWAITDGFYPQRAGNDRRKWTVFGHGEMLPVWGVSYATACPGGMPLDVVTKRAQEILASGAPMPEPTLEEQISMSDITIIERVTAKGAHDGEWMRVDRELGPQLDDDGNPVTYPGVDGKPRVRLGFRVTNNWDEASLWLALWGIGTDRDAVKLQRDSYIRVQDFVVQDTAEWQNNMIALNGGSNA
jgi:hypothetical protein